MEGSGSASDIGSIDCFQNYTAPEVFVQGLAGQINQQDIEAIIRAQKQMLQRFEKTNEMLSNCNTLAYNRFVLAQKELKRHITLINEMKKDFDNIFKRIRTIKKKLSQQFPGEYQDVRKRLDVEVQYSDEEYSKEEELSPTACLDSTLTSTSCDNQQ